MNKITNQELYYDILLKKYNILKKNLIIIEQTEEKKEEFKNTIKEIDKIEQEKFKKELEIKKELTTNLKDEYKRLFDYINLLEDRNNSRVSMLEDYNNIVKGKIDDLEEIEDYDNMDFYVQRLDDINEYLNNDEKYNKFKEEKNEYTRIKDEYQNKVEILNKLLGDYELNLLIKLKNSINNNKIYEELDFDNLDESISTYEEKLQEKEREFNTYLSSYEALLNVELIETEKEDYLGFVEEEKKEFLKLLEKKYILLFYKYINENELEKVLELYDERIEKLNKYNLKNNFDLNEVLDIINNYVKNKEELKEVKLTIESIENNINEVENKLESLKQELNNPNIVNLLKEFCIEKDYIVNNKEETVEEFASETNNEILERKDNGINDLISNDDNSEEIEIIENENLFENEVIEEKNIQENNVFEEILFNNNLDDGNNKEELELNFSDNIFEPETIEDNNITEIKEIIPEENTIEELSTIEEEIEQDNNQENNIVEDIKIENEEDNNEEFIVIEDVQKPTKENAIIEAKDINEFLLIEEIRTKALKIMKSVCESIA